MAATTFKNVTAASIGGVAISSVLSVSLDFDGDVQYDKTDGAVYPTTRCTGAQVKSITVTSRDPISTLAARGASGACSFALKTGGDAAGTSTFTLGDGVGFGWSWDNGAPGANGEASIQGQLIGDTFSEA